MAKDKSARNIGDGTKSLTKHKRNEFDGVVVSDKMQKTISVQVFSLVKHAKYGKFMRKSSIFKAHDEKSEAKMGDTVRIFEGRPFSKTKRWVLAKILDKRKQVEGVEI